MRFVQEIDHHLGINGTVTSNHPSKESQCHNGITPVCPSGICNLENRLRLTPSKSGLIHTKERLEYPQSVQRSLLKSSCEEDA